MCVRVCNVCVCMRKHMCISVSVWICAQMCICMCYQRVMRSFLCRSQSRLTEGKCLNRKEAEHTLARKKGPDECSSAESFLSPETPSSFSHSEQVELRDEE